MTQAVHAVGAGMIAFIQPGASGRCERMGAKAAQRSQDDAGVCPQGLDVVDLQNCYTANELISDGSLGLWRPRAMARLSRPCWTAATSTAAGWRPTRRAATTRCLSTVTLPVPAARPMGLPPAGLSMAYLGRWLTNWLPQQHLRRSGVRFVAITQGGDQFSCSGRVTELFAAELAQGSARRARLTLQTGNQHGQVKLAGDAVIALD